MSTEEVYFRLFVTAAAIAAVVALLVAGIGLALRKKLGETGLGIVGGLTLALAWIAAHQAMRGPEAWADLMRGGYGWSRALWPIEATERFHVPIACALAGGIMAALAPRKGAGRNVVRWTARIGAMSAIAWVAAGPLAESAYAIIALGALFGIAWWAALEDSAPPPSGALMPLTGAMCTLGFGALMLMQYAVTLGLVAICGAGALCVLAIAGVREPRLTRGPVACAVVAGGWVALFVGAQVYAHIWPALSVALACAAPGTPAVFSVRWIKERPAWNRWVVQLGTTAALFGLAAFVVYWIEHHNPSTRL